MVPNVNVEMTIQCYSPTAAPLNCWLVACVGPLLQHVMQNYVWTRVSLKTLDCQCTAAEGCTTATGVEDTMLSAAVTAQLPCRTEKDL